MWLASLAHGGDDLSGRLDQIFRRAKLAYHDYQHDSSLYREGVQKLKNSHETFSTIP